MNNQGGIQRMINLFWDKEVENTDLENPIHVLGKQYKPDSAKPLSAEESIRKDEELSKQDPDDKSIDNPFDEIKSYFQSLSFVNQTQRALGNSTLPWPQEFIDEVNSKVWFTYRTHFKPLDRDVDGPSPLSLKSFLRGQTHELDSEHFTTDCGWGCMIRTSQTLLANAIMKLRSDGKYEMDQEYFKKVHDETVGWFVDSPEYPFSIHKIVEKGRLLSGKKAGEWFGPSAAARSIQALCAEFDSGLKVHIGSDAGDIYEQDLFKVFKEGGEFKPTLILLGVRLGVEKINNIYWDSLKSILASPESCGISGGRPSSSHYFFGYQSDYLFYLDPHFPQQALEYNDETKKVSNPETVHTKKIRKIHISEVDPSMLIGVLLKSEDEWYKWKSKIQDVQNKNTIIHISPDNSHAEMANRKPSFVVYNEDGDDFVDVGYEDLVEEEPDTTDPDLELEQSQKTEEEYMQINGTEKDQDVSVVYLSQPTVPQVNSLSTTSILEEPVKVEINDPDTSFEEYSGEIKDDYENIATESAMERDTDYFNTVEVESVHQEEPYIVQESEIGSPVPAHELKRELEN